MKTASPLRYPGGKSAMSGLLQKIRHLNGLGDLVIAEPFAGGAGASLSLLYLEETPAVHINDADPAIHDFWWSLTNRFEQFVDMISTKRVSMAEWRRQREIYRSPGRVARLKRGFSAFYLNRCNRSGIIVNGGPIGGISQTGNWLLDARFNKDDLIARCQKVAEYRDRIHVSRDDGIAFISKQRPNRVMCFIDPPYFVKGKTLYLNTLDDGYHKQLGEQLRKMKDAAWILTYDDCPEIRKIYKGWATIRPFGLRYAASDRRSGKEILIAPKWMKLPSVQSSAAIDW